MDTQNSAVAEVPNFKLAKVGKDRERKRSGAAWLGGGRGAGSGLRLLGGAGGGAGAGAAAGMTGAKMALILLAAAMASTGAWIAGSRGAGGDEAPAAKKLFADKGGAQKYDDLSGVIRSDNSIPNSLGYVSGSKDGLTPEERAKKAAEAEAARKAQEEADKKAQAEADKQAKADAAKDAKVPGSALDPNALAKLDGSDKKGLKAGKFGQLSSAFGGSGLSGGAGLSGGINRNFGGAAGLGGNAPKAQSGSVASFKHAAAPGSSRATARNAGGSKSKGFARRQLDNAFTQSRQAMSAGKSESAAAGAAAPFDNGAPGGNVIEGPGVGAGNKTGPADSSPNNTGGPLGSGTSSPCGSGQYADSNGACQNINTNFNKKRESQYDSLIAMAKMMLITVAILGIIAMILKNWQAVPWVAAVLQAIRIILMLLGAAIAVIGATILAQYHQTVIGGIMALSGAFIAVMAYISPEKITAAQVIPQLAAPALISSAVGYLAASQAKAPSAAMQ